MKEYFCSLGHEFNKDEVKKWAHHKIRGDLPSFGISICPFCQDKKIDKIKMLFDVYDNEEVL